MGSRFPNANGAVRLWLNDEQERKQGCVMVGVPEVCSPYHQVCADKVYGCVIIHAQFSMFFEHSHPQAWSYSFA